MGILDALIVPEKYQGSIPQSDKILVPHPQLFQHTLADLLVATPVEGSGVTEGTIINVLQSILLEDRGDSQAVVRKDGSYQMALLEGRAPSEEAARFIGHEARKRYRQKMIEKLTEELKVLEEIQADLGNSLDKGGIGRRLDWCGLCDWFRPFLLWPFLLWPFLL